MLSHLGCLEGFREQGEMDKSGYQQWDILEIGSPNSVALCSRNKGWEGM